MEWEEERSIVTDVYIFFSYLKVYFFFWHFCILKFCISFKKSTTVWLQQEKAVAPHSSTLAWKIPWAEELGGCSPRGHEDRIRLSDFTFTFHFHALEKEMATHSSVLAWRILGMGEPGGLLSMGLHRVRHDWSDLAAAAYFIHSSLIFTKFPFSVLGSHLDTPLHLVVVSPQASLDCASFSDFVLDDLGSYKGYWAAIL